MQANVSAGAGAHALHVTFMDLLRRLAFARAEYKMRGHWPRILWGRQPAKATLAPSHSDRGCEPEPWRGHSGQRTSASSPGEALRSVSEPPCDCATSRHRYKPSPTPPALRVRAVSGR